MDTKERSHYGNQLKTVFNQLWDESLKRNENTLPYRDMARIADALKHEGPSILQLENLPVQIEAGLGFAISSVDPNKASAQTNLKHALSLLAGSGGLALAAIFLGQLVNPGAWAIIVTFVAGGVAGGPIAIIGVAGGLMVVTGCVYAAFQKMSPQERAVKAHEFVMKGIDNWIEKGGGENKRVSTDTYDQLHGVKQDKSLPEKFSDHELAAADAILRHIASCDGGVSDVELRTIEDCIGIGKEFGRLEYKNAIKSIQSGSLEKRKEVVAWCFGIAYSDKTLHPKEDETLRNICFDLGVNYDDYLAIFNDKK